MWVNGVTGIWYFCDMKATLFLILGFLVGCSVSQDGGQVPGQAVDDPHDGNAQSPVDYSSDDANESQGCNDAYDVFEINGVYVSVPIPCNDSPVVIDEGDPADVTDPMIDVDSFESHSHDA